MKPENFDYVIKEQEVSVKQAKEWLIDVLSLNENDISNWSVIDNAIMEFQNARNELHGMFQLLNLSKDDDFLTD